MGVFANALSFAMGQREASAFAVSGERRSLAAWLLGRLHRRKLQQPRLALVERIILAPRQTVALIEADGQRLLVATSADGSATFLSLEITRSSRTSPRPRKTAAEGNRA